MVTGLITYLNIKSLGGDPYFSGGSVADADREAGAFLHIGQLTQYFYKNTFTRGGLGDLYDTADGDIVHQGIILTILPAAGTFKDTGDAVDRFSVVEEFGFEYSAIEMGGRGGGGNACYRPGRFGCGYRFGDRAIGGLC